VGKDKLCSSGGFGGGWVGENILLSELPAEESIFVLFDKFEVCSSLCLEL